MYPLKPSRLRCKRRERRFSFSTSILLEVWRKPRLPKSSFQRDDSNRQCRALKLATPECYRKYEADANGIRDEKDAR